MLISNENVQDLKVILQNPSQYEEKKDYINLMQKLSDGGFIINEEANEIKIIEEKYNKYINSPHYSLNILTSYDCNFSCWYCVQRHKKEHIEEETIQRIKKHIKKQIQEKNLQYFELTWFGGEPLLYPNAITEISSYAQKLCQEFNLTFINSITTNGSLLNNRIIQQFKEIQLNKYQITIDGDQDTHNAIRKSSTINDSFSVICNNIKNILDSIGNSYIILRFNYTAKNISEKLAQDLIKNIPSTYRQRIEFFPRKVWQEDETTIPYNILDKLCNQIKEAGFSINQTHDIESFVCYEEKKDFYTIFHNGRVDKCANIALKDTRGYLSECGNIEWEQIPQEMNTSIFNMKLNCRTCKFLPICMGPCPIRRRQILEKKGNGLCPIKQKQVYFHSIIKNYFLSFYKP